MFYHLAWQQHAMHSQNYFAHWLSIGVGKACELRFIWMMGLWQLKASCKEDPGWHSPFAVHVVYSDASETGYGGYMVEHGCHTAHGRWFEDEATQSFTWRDQSSQISAGISDSFAQK